MKLNYDRETDSLYIDLNSRPSADSREIQDGVHRPRCQKILLTSLLAIERRWF